MPNGYAEYSGYRKGEVNMQARGPLMIEHRLIERMLSISRNVLVQFEEHVFGRQTTNALVAFYPRHIEKEDKVFF
jgi:hemerythrin-like domain-containing protein